MTPGAAETRPGARRLLGASRFFLAWREPTVTAEHDIARLRAAGTVQPDDLIVSAIWYGEPQPPSRWVTQEDLSAAEKDRLLVVAQNALGAGWIAERAAALSRPDLAWWSEDELLAIARSDAGEG